MASQRMEAEPGHGAPGGTSPPVIPTKIVLPSRPLVPIVARPRLTELLRESVRTTALTLLSAPAGSGKSALVEDWARSEPPGSVAWVRLDHTDDERRSFWRTIMAGLAAAGILEPQAVPTGRYDVDDVLPVLMSALDERTEAAVLVIEDLQEISHPDVFVDVERLLRIPPRALRVVATTRFAPRIRLQRLRLEQQVVTIDAPLLAFTADEARQFADRVGAPIGDADLQHLLLRTEGWAAGLALAIRAVVDAPDPSTYVASLVGTEAPLADYILEEVLSYVPQRTAQFMLETSIVDPVGGALADAITGDTGGGATLDDLARRGMLVTALDDRREWFHYHPLLRGYLEARLRRDAAADLPLLHRRAAEWFAAEGSDVAAVRHAIAADDGGRVCALVASRWLICAMQGELGQLVRTLRSAPEPWQMTPHLAVPFAMHALDAGHPAEADEWLTIANAGRDRLSPAARLGLAVAELHRYRMVGDKAHAEQAVLDGRAIDVAAIEGDAETGARLRYLAVCALGKLELGIIELWTGELADADGHLREAIDQSRATGAGFVAHVALAYLGYLQLFTGDLQAAAEHALAADALAQEHDWPLTEGAPVVRSVLGHVALFTGRLDEADVHLTAARQLTARSPDLPLRAYTQMQLGRLRLAQGHPRDALALVDAAERLLLGTAFGSAIAPLADVLRARARELLGDTAGEDETTDRDATEAGVVVVRARRILAAGDPAAADAAIDAWRRQGEPALHPTMRVLALLVQAQARSTPEVDADPAEPLGRALLLADGTGARLPFLEAGPAVVGLLARYPGTGRHAALAREITAMLAGSGAESPDARALEPSEELSERELAVLRFLPTSLTNREIADELFVSVNTVKTHVKQIYRKLGAHDRREAVVRARQLGLVPAGLVSRERSTLPASVR